KDRADFDLVRAVEDRLGRPSAAQYGLSVAQSVSQTALAVQGSAAITRYNLVGTASYTLRDIGTNALVVSGNVDTFTSYSATASTVGTSFAEVDARRRLSVALGDLIVSQLLIDVPETQL
ncbi:MAG: LPS-assembly lipoprotein, partial [Dinoroseobacter sp.]